VQRGIVAGVTAYLIWGLFPLYWPLLEPAGALEILAHRMVWSLVVMALLVTGLRQWRAIVSMPPRVLGLVVAAAVLIAVNWAMYIWAVNNGRVVEAALGYYINPLVSVVLGVLVFRERLRVAQWIAVGLGTAAVVVIAVGGGAVPYIAIGLALSFATYGLVKKVVPLQPTESLTAEGLVLLVPALSYLVVLQVSGTSTLTGHGSGHVVLLLTTGLVTVGPLLAFGAAARALPLSVLGLLQYLTPTVQFLLGVLYFGERMPPARWIGFGLVWAALAVLTADILRRRRAPAPVPAAAPVGGS
jgi:chloramphenicol-sensitive protein RarD